MYFAKLKPMLKKGARSDPRNYRPISLLPLVSKIIEKSIHFQIKDYLNKIKTNLYVSVMLQEEPFNRPLSGSVDRLCFNWHEERDACRYDISRSSESI